MKETTANRLKQIMKEEHLRQVDIIRLCEPFCTKYNLRLTKSDLSQFVNGKVVPGQWKISILSHALNVDEAWLMGYDVPRARKPDLTPDEVRDYVEALSADDERLLDLFHKLNPIGHQLLLTTAESFAANPDLQLDPPAASVS